MDLALVAAREPPIASYNKEFRLYWYSFLTIAKASQRRHLGSSWSDGIGGSNRSIREGCKLTVFTDDGPDSSQREYGDPTSASRQEWSEFGNDEDAVG